MKKFLIILLFFVFHSLSAQESEKITLSFEKLPLKQVILLIEEKTDLHFYFLEHWLDSTPISGHFQNQPVEEILSTIFSETLLNFHIMQDGKVILTRNMLVYSELPQDFFGIQETVVEEVQEGEKDVYKPIFSNTMAAEAQQELETVRIGKETMASRTGTFLLSGRVTDAETGEPLPNLAVVVEEQDLGAVTDENGYYSLSLPAGVHILETKSLITEPFRKRVIIFNEGQLDFQLKENLELLGEVVLEADALENVEETNTGVDQINVKEIRNIPTVLGERDILKVATTLPGISTAGEGAAGFNVRGGKADQNLFLLDEAVLYNPSHFFGLFSALNPFTSGEVNIYKGSMPAEYGGRLSSVFDVKTKDANIQQFAGEASIGPVTSNLALELPIIPGKSGLLVGGRSTYSDWILKNLDEESLKNSTAAFYDIVAKYNHIIDERSEIEATGYFSQDRFSITSDSLYNYSNRLLTLRYNRSINSKHQGSIILSNSDYRFNVDYDSNFDNDFTSGYGINETQVKLQLDYKYNEKHLFKYGIASKLYLIEPGNMDPLGSESTVETINIPQEKGLESAVYLSDDLEFNDKFTFTAGLRYSWFAALGQGIENVYEAGKPKSEATLLETISYGNNEIMQSYGGLSTRLSARYLLLPDLSLKASYNNNFQYIHTLTNNTTVSPTDMYKLSSRNIKPQRGQQVSLGLYKNFQENTYEVSLEGYYKKSQNSLDFKVGAQLFLNQQIESEVLQGDGKSYGIEFLLKKTKGDLNGWIGYSYNRSLLRLDSQFPEERVNDGEYFPSNFDKPHDFSFVGNYKFTKRYSMSANFIYQTGRPVTFPVGKYEFNGAEYVVYSDRNEFRIPDYFRLDLSLNIEGNHKIKKLAHSFWNISVYNVLGRNNPYSMFFVTDDGEVQAMQSSIFSVPVPTISYNIKF